MDEEHATTTLPLTTTTWHNRHRLPLYNSGALPPVHELFKRPSHELRADKIVIRQKERENKF
jgi:hypothetical protein